MFLQEGNDPLLTIKSEIVGVDDRSQIRVGRPGGGIQSAHNLGRKKRMILSTNPKTKADTQEQSDLIDQGGTLAFALNPKSKTRVASYNPQQFAANIPASA